MFILDNPFLLLTGLPSAYQCWHFFQQYQQNKALLFHGVAGLVIFLGPFIAKGAPKGFRWAGIGGLLIGLSGIALAFISVGRQLLFFRPAFVMIITPLLILMTAAFSSGFTRNGDISSQPHLAGV